MATKTFDALPSWTDVESSSSFQTADPKSRSQAFDLWKQDFIETAAQDPDNLSPEGWQQFKKRSKEKKAELRGSVGFIAATEEVDDEAETDAPDRIQLASRRRELETKATKTIFGGGGFLTLPIPEQEELTALRGALSDSDDDDLDAVEETANDDREFHVANGQFYASPSLALSTSRYREAVNKTSLTTEQKAEALMRGKILREDVGSRLRGELTNMEDAFEDSVWGSDKFREFEKDLRDGNPDASDADVMEKWQKENGSWYSNLGTQLKLGALRGASDTVGGYYGLKRLVGSKDEETVLRAEAAGQLSGQLASASQAAGGATLAADAASMVVTSLATAPAGLAGRGVVALGRAGLAVAGRTAAAATAGRLGAGALARAATLRAGGDAAARLVARQVAMSSAGGLAAASFAAGMQSAGGAFNQYYDDFLKEEMSRIPTDQQTPETVEAARRRARDGARARAIVSGLVTAAITAGFGATGAEKLSAPNVSKAAQAAREGMFVFLGKSLGKEALSEATEEGLDEGINGIIDKLTVEPGKPVSEVIKETLTAAVAGGLLGAGMSAPFASWDAYEARKQAKQNPAVQAQLSAADKAEGAGASAVAAVVREQAEGDVQTNLDRKAAEAQRVADAALTPAPAYEQATIVARAVKAQLETLTPDDPAREALQQRLDGINAAISASGPETMIPMAEPAQASDVVEASDPFNAPADRATEIQSRLDEIEKDKGPRQEVTLAADGTPTPGYARINTTEEDALLKELDALNQAAPAPPPVTNPAPPPVTNPAPAQDPLTLAKSQPVGTKFTDSRDDVWEKVLDGWTLTSKEFEGSRGVATTRPMTDETATKSIRDQLLAAAPAAAPAPVTNPAPPPVTNPAPAPANVLPPGATAPPKFPVGKGAIVFSDAYRSSGNLTVTGDPVWDAGEKEWKYPIVTQEGRSFEKGLSERHLTRVVSPAPAPAPTTSPQTPTTNESQVTPQTDAKRLPPSPEGVDYPQARDGSRAVVTTPSSAILSELAKLPSVEAKLNWLRENGFLTQIEGSNSVEHEDRVMVLMRVGNANIPFYISTGRAGKKNVAVGKWYAVWGIGSSGWINKGREEDINTQYGYPVLQKLAKILNEGVGSIDPSSVPALSDFDSVNSQMNMGFTPAADPSDQTFWSNVSQALTRVNEETEKLGKSPAQQTPAPPPLAAPFKTPPKPTTPTTNDTQAKEPPAGGVPSVKGQPAVRAQEGQSETRAPSGGRQDQASSGKALTKPEAALSRAEVKRQAAELAKRLTANATPPAGVPQERGKAPAPAPATTPQKKAEEIIQQEMFDAKAIPSSSVVSSKMKALTGKGFALGSPPLKALMDRLRAAWEAAYPPQSGLPDGFFTGSVDGAAMKRLPKKEKSINDAGGRVPFKTVGGKRVGFFTNDPVITAKQINAGLKITVPVELRKKVAPGIEINPTTGVVTAAYDFARGATAVKKAGDWHALYKASPQRAARAETLLVEGEKVAAKTGKTLEELADELRQTTNLINAMVSGKKKSSAAVLSSLKEEKKILVRQVIAMTKTQNPRTPFVGTDAYLAQHAPAEVPGEDVLLTAYLRLGARLGLSDGVDELGGLTYVQNTVRKTVATQWPSLLESDMLTAIEGAVINDATVKVRKLLMGNPDADPATLLASLPNMVQLVHGVVKKFGEADRTYRSVISGSIDEELSTADRLTAGLATEVAQVDAEALAERMSEDESAATPLTDGEIELLRKDLQAMNDGNPDEFSLGLLMNSPLQARRALAAIEQGLQFKVGPDGDLIFEYGPALKAEESQELTTILDGVVPPGSTDLFKRLSSRPNVARFLIDLTTLGREALKSEKTRAGAPMFKAEDLRKMNLVEVCKIVKAGDQTASGRIIMQARENLAVYSDSTSLTLTEARTILGALLGESATKPAEVRGRSTTPTSLDQQRAQEKVAGLKSVLDATKDTIDFSNAELARLKEADRVLKERASELQDQLKQPNAKKDQIQRELNKANGAISRNRENIVLTEQSLEGLTKSLEGATKAYAAVAIRSTPPPAPVVAAQKAKVDEALKNGEKKSEAKRRQATSPAPTKATNAGLAMIPETPTPVNTESDRSMFKSELAAIGLTSGADAAGIITVLKRLSVKEGTGSTHFKSLARIFSDNPALLNGISSVEIVENPALADDVSVVNGVLTLNVAAMTPVLDGTPRGPEALLRGVITHATKSLTSPEAVLSTNQRTALGKLEALRQEAIAMEPGTRAPGLQPRFTDALTDTASFMEAMLTSPEFGEMLQSYNTSIKTPKLKSAWGRFWAAVGELLTGKVVPFGSTLHVGLMNAGALMTSSPCPGKRFLDSIKAVIHNPEIAFPKTRTASAEEVTHQQLVNEAVEVADSPATTETVEARLLGDDSAAADPESTSSDNAALMPDNSMLGTSFPDPKMLARETEEGRLPGPPTSGRVVFVPRVIPPAPAGSETLTEQQAFAGLSEAIRTVDLVDKVARGVLTPDEAGAAVVPAAIQSALDAITAAIERLKGSPAANKDQFIPLLEDMQAFLQLEQEQIVSPPAKFDAMSDSVQGIDTESLPEESDVPFAEPAEEGDTPFAEPYIETTDEAGSTQPIDFGPFILAAPIQTGHRVAMVDAGPGVPEQPLYVRHDRSDTLIYMNKAAMTALVEKLRAAGYTTSEMTAHLNALLDREASTLAILQRFSDGELLATARSLTPEQRRKIIKRVYGLKPGDPGFQSRLSAGLSGSSQDVTADMIQLGADYYRMMRQVSETGHTTEDVMDMVASSPGTLARTAAFLKATAQQFMTWWRAYGDVNATRAILNIESFVNATQPSKSAFQNGALALPFPLYHGTPHKVHKFLSSRIGTGEGNQAFGYGLYFASNVEVAKAYQKNLSGRGMAEPVEESPAAYEAVTLLSYYRGNKEAAKKEARRASRAGELNEWVPLKEVLHFIDLTEVPTGNLYTVEVLPDEGDFLDWDKPLSEQSEKVQEVIAQALPHLGEFELVGRVDLDTVDPTGKDIYAAIIALKGGKPRDASQMLSEAGVAGVRYLDGASRWTSKGNHNFVVFDESHIKVTEENGQEVAPEEYADVLYQTEKVAPASTKPKVAKHEAVKIVASNKGLSVEEVLADIKMVKRIRKSMKQHVVGSDSPETTPMNVGDARKFVESLGLTNRDPKSVATALGRIADMPNVNPALRVIARQLSQNPQIAALADFDFVADSGTMVNGKPVPAAGIYNALENTISLELPFMVGELTSFTSDEKTPWSQAFLIETLIHEAVHAVTTKAVRDYSSGVAVSPEIKDAIEGLSGLRAAIANQKGAEKFEYGLSSIDEFIAAVSSDPNFVTWLASLPNSVGADVPGETGSMSIVKRILRRIYQIIFPKLEADSALEKSLSRVFDLAAYPHLAANPSKTSLNNFYQTKLANTALRRKQQLADAKAAQQEMESQFPGYDAETAALEDEMSSEVDAFDIDPEDELALEAEALAEEAEAAFAGAFSKVGLYAPMKTPPTARFLPGFVTGERKATEALKNSLPAMPSNVQDYLKESTYFSGVAERDLAEVDAQLGKALSGATGAAEFASIALSLDDLPMTDPQRFLARVVVGQALNRRINDLTKALETDATTGGFGLLKDYEGVAKSVWHSVQDIASTSGQMLSAAAIARDLINPKIVAATYRDAATKASGKKMPKDVDDAFTGLKKDADDVAAGVVKKSPLTKKIVAAIAKSSSGDPAEVQMMFDFMESLQNFVDQGISTGVPIPAKMAEWVAEQMLGMVDSKIRAQIKKVAEAAGESEQTFFEEYSDEVKRLVAQRINQALKGDTPARPTATAAQKAEAKKKALAEAISYIEFAPSVERALIQSKAKLLARLEASKGSTPEALKRYEDAKAAIGAMAIDLVPMSKAADIVRRSFDMQQQVYMSLSDQHGSVVQLAATISKAAGLTSDQSRKVAEAFKAAYEAEMNRRIQKTLTSYATRRSMSEGRGAAERYSRSDRFLRLARIGGLRKEEFYNAMATEFGLPSYDPAIADELDREAERILAMPVGSVQRNDATRDLNARITNETYKSLLNAYGAKAIIKDREMTWEYLAGIPVAMWKSGVLSGFGTSEVNFGFGTVQSIMDLAFNASAYAVKAKDPALAASNLLTLVRAVGWIGDPTQRGEVWTEMKRAALTGRTRFASEQSENMLVLERDVPPPDIPGIKQLMNSAKTFFKLIGRIGAVIDSTVSVPAAIARQRLALQYALTMGGADRKKIAEVMQKSFSPEELESREINEVLESEKDQFRNSPRPDLAMQARRFQLMEQRRAQTYAELTSRLDVKSKEDFMEASRESARFANLGTTPTGIAGAIFDRVFGSFERQTKGLSSIIVSFPRAMGNLLDFSLAMSVPVLSYARANNFSPSQYLLGEDSRYKRELVDKDSIKYHKLIAQSLVATVAQLAIGALYWYGMEEEEEGRVPWFMVYGKGYPDSERNRQLRYRQPSWSPYTVKLGGLYLSWKDIPGFNLLLGGLASLTDDRMVKGLKDPKKIRPVEAAANTAVAFIKAITVKNSLQGLAQAGEILSDNDLAEAVTAQNMGKMLTNFISGATNPRVLRDVVDIGRGVAGGGEYALKDTRGFTAATISLLPANALYGAELGQRDMLNSMGEPVTNFWYAPMTKRVLPVSASDNVDPIITPLVSSGLFLSPVKAGQMTLDTYKDDSSEVDKQGGLLSSFDPSVEADSVKMFGEQMRLRMSPEYVKELTALAEKSRTGREDAQKALNKECEEARAYVKSIIQARIFNREIVPHWQKK